MVFSAVRGLKESIMHRPANVPGSQMDSQVCNPYFGGFYEPLWSSLLGLLLGTVHIIIPFPKVIYAIILKC